MNDLLRRSAKYPNDLAFGDFKLRGDGYAYEETRDGIANALKQAPSDAEGLDHYTD